MDLNDFAVAEGRRQTLLVLGAGSTRGASFVEQGYDPQPPLDADFFQQLARQPPMEASKRLMRFVREEFGSEVGLSMEEFFSEVDYTDRFHREMKVDRGRHVLRYERALDDFLTALPALLVPTTTGRCFLHEALVSRLHSNDSIITFNYDCVADCALRDVAGRRWDPDKDGYGFPIESGGSHWKDHSTGTRSPAKTIRLLKMHGSANWNRRTTGSVALYRDVSATRSLKSAIIPPTWFKALTDSPFDSVWKTARKAVRSARAIIVVGYSMPPTDLFSRSLFKVEAGSKDREEKLDLLVLVNPDREARRRFLNVIRGGIEPTTTIREYSDLTEVVDLLNQSSSLRSLE